MDAQPPSSRTRYPGSCDFCSRHTRPRAGNPSEHEYRPLMSRTFESSVIVSAPAQAVFDLTQDYGRRLDWDPFLIEARLVNAAAPGVGVRAWCVGRRPRIGMETEYVSFDPPRVAAVKMTRGPWFLRSFAGSWRFEPLSPTETRVAFRYSLVARPGILRPLLAAYFARETRARLAALRGALK